MRRLIFVNRYFFPDQSATSQLLSDLAFHLVEHGHQVHVVTSQQLYGDAQATLTRHEEIKGVQIHRTASTKFGRASLLGRGFDYASFYGSALRKMRKLAQAGDILVAKTDPPLMSVVARSAARNRGAHLVNWLQDIYPEVGVELGVPFLRGPVVAQLSRRRDASLRAAACNVVVGERMARKLVSRGIARESIRVIHNWTDDEQLNPVDHSQNPLRAEWGLQDKFVVGYSGNLGRAHEFETLLGAAEALREHPSFRFVFIGTGAQAGEVAAQVKARGLEPMFRFFPYQDRDMLQYSLGVPDVHWISLRPELEGLIVPSKFYGIAAAGRPIITVTARDGELARLVREHQCGLVIEPGNPRELAGSLMALSGRPQSVHSMGVRARQMLDMRFTRKHAFEQWRDALENLTEQDNSA
jgi:glycosyltransferase involved in cell wall biosynthesis